MSIRSAMHVSCSLLFLLAIGFLDVSAQTAKVKFGSYNAFGDSIAEGCCVSGGSITESSVHNHIATITVISSASQPVPAVGDILARVSETTNAGGALNFDKENHITTIGGGFANVGSYDGQAGKITGTISYNVAAPDTEPAAEKGSFRAATYVSHVASVLGIPVGNRSKSGTTCADMGPRVLERKVTSTGYALYTLQDGVNDIGALNAGEPPHIHLEEAISQFVRCTRAEDVFLATPADAIVLASRAADHASGWIDSTLHDPFVGPGDLDSGRAPSFERMSLTKGASLTANVRGTAVAVGYEATASSDGAAQIAIDGDLKTSLSSVPPCANMPTYDVALSRHAGLVTTDEISPKLQPNTWVIVQNAKNPSFNGMFAVHSVTGNSVTWLQKGTDTETAGKIGPSLCAMTQPRYGRTFTPQAIIIKGLATGPHSVKITVSRTQVQDTKSTSIMSREMRA